jgi:hypothetical protein
MRAQPLSGRLLCFYHINGKIIKIPLLIHITLTIIKKKNLKKKIVIIGMLNLLYCSSLPMQIVLIVLNVPFY